MADKIKFWPIRGTEAQILDQPYYDGKIYFAYDTNKIYLDVDGSKHLMGGGNSGIIYAQGTDTTISKKSENEEDTQYYIDFSAFESTVVLPQENDLILNSDGRFFRVLSVDTAEQKVLAALLAVSGTGGGGGGGTTPVAADLTLSVDTQTISANATYIYGQDYNIYFTLTSTIDDAVAATVKFYEGAYSSNKEPIFTSPRIDGISGEPIAFNMGLVDYIGSNISIRIEGTSDNSQMENGVVRNYSGLKIVDMHLEKPAGSGYLGIISDADVGGLILSYIPYGNNLTLALHAAVDGNEFATGITLTNQNMGQRQTLSIPDQSHGTHEISLWVSTEINGTTLESAPISYEAAWAKSDDMTPVIWVGPHEETVIQYENAVIPYMVYDPVQQQYGLSTEVHYYHNGVEIAASPVNVSYSTTGWLTWDVTSLYRVGENRFTIVNGVSSKEVVINITTEGSRDLGLVNESALLTNFTSSGRSSSEIKTNRSIWKSSKGSASAVFNSFNWYNNGWKDDDDGEGSYLSIANDASVTIPYGNMSINNDRNYTFEIRFRVKNIQKYSTLVTQVPLYKYWMPPFIYDEENKVVGGTENTKGQELTLKEIEDNGYVVKLDSDGNKDMEQSNPTRKIVEDENGIAFKYLNSDGYGFAIGTQEAYFATAGRVVNVRYKEDEIINISFVVDKTNTTLYIYLNGILTGAADLNNVPSFTMQSIPFTINSNYCDFDLYKFRIYQVALTMPEVIHNYLSDMRDISLYDENQLTNVNDDTALDYNKLVQYNIDHPDDPTMPYAVIDMSMFDDDRLPYIKASNNTKIASITFVNPTADRLLEKGEITEFDYYTHCPSFTSENVDINVQGTSSQGYPRRNYKTKFKTAKKTWVYTQGSLAGTPIADGGTDKDGKKIGKKWHMDNTSLATNKFTWKIDYMESSGSYNTGFANMMGNNLYNKHPLDDLGIDASNYRTSVYGFPLLVFHKTKDGKITYIGRYNINLDKSANEYYGFEEEVEHPYINAPWDEVDDKTGEVTHHDHPYIADIAECWELRDNQGVWCSFKYPNETSRGLGFATPSADSTESAPKLEIPLHFEPRYNKEADEIEAAYNYTTTVDGEDFSDIIGNDNAAMCQYLRRKYSNLEILFNWLDSTDTDKATNTVFDEPRRISVVSTVANDPTVSYETITDGGVTKTYGTFTADTKEYRRQKFRAEFNKHLDEHYCAIYYIMTELLLCYDSRGKNMMIATFGPHEVGGDYIWYPIFYDIDTQLGLNNVGALLWDYNEDATENKTFSTAESVLWVNFADMYASLIRSTYAALRSGGDGAKLSYNTIEGAYTCNPGVFKNSTAMKGKRPIIAIGLDEYYKYLAPITQGYYDTAGTIQSGSSGNYLYACQGDRKLSRELFITNRLNYMDSKWPAGAYDTEAAKQEIYMRLNANYAGTSDVYLDSNTLSELPSTARADQVLAPYPVPFFDTIPQYTITPFLDQYVTMFYDENRLVTSEAYNPEKYPDGMKTNIDSGREDAFKTNVIQQQIIYFPAGDFLSSLGDMSTKYIDSIGLYHGKRLLDITLGSDVPGYYNDQAGSGTIFSLGDDANSNNKKTLLKKINLTGLRRLAEFQDVSGSEKLQEFRALNTSLPYAVFAKGAPLNTLHLPKSTTELRLAENKNLTKILRERPEVLVLDEQGRPTTTTDGKLIYKDHSEYEGLYLEDITDYDPTKTYAEACKLTTIQTDNDALGYDSYEILANTVKRKTGTDGSLAIQMNNVTWTPYVQVEYGEVQNSNTTYYLLTDHSTYVNYAGGDWDNLTLNGKIYTLDTSVDSTIVSDLSLFDQFIADYERCAEEGTINQFTNTNGYAIASRPTITGELFVNNTNGTPIEEDKLTDIYGVAWPQLTIRVANVKESYLAKYVQIDPNTQKEVELDIVRYNTTTYDGQPIPAISTKASPYRQYYDFRGWSFEPVTSNDETEVMNKLAYNAQTSEWTSLGRSRVFSENDTVITLYAVFTQTLYSINFYNPDGSLITTRYTTYGRPIPDPQISPSYEVANMELTEVYSFKGWTREQANALPTAKSRINSILVNLSRTIVTEDGIKLYAVYFKQSVYDEPSNLDLFDFTDITLRENSFGIPEAYQQSTPYTGVEVRLKSTASISGKITLPAYYNGKPVVSIGTNAFRIQNDEDAERIKMTHLFWYTEGNQEPQLKVIRSYAFGAETRYSQSLQYIELPEGLRIVESRAFSGAKSITSIGVKGGTATEGVINLPSTLVVVGTGGFGVAFKDGYNLTTINIPGSVVKLETQSFGPVRGNVTNFVIGSSDSHSQLEYLGTELLSSVPSTRTPAFYVSSNQYRVENFTFYASTEAQWENIQSCISTSGSNNWFIVDANTTLSNGE